MKASKQRNNKGLMHCGIATGPRPRPVIQTVEASIGNNTYYILSVTTGTSRNIQEGLNCWVAFWVKKKKKRPENLTVGWHSG